MALSFWYLASMTTSVRRAPVPSIWRSFLPRIATRFWLCGHCFCWAKERIW